VTPDDVFVNGLLGQALALARLVADFQRKPLGVPFTIAVARVAIVENVSQLVNEHIVEIEIANGVLGPDELPGSPLVHPTSTIHRRFNALRGLRRMDKRLDE